METLGGQGGGDDRGALETFLRGMETLFLYLFIFIPDYLETFLRGMETGLYTPAASWTKCLETFLRGMETLGDKSWAAGGGGTLKPSLEGWKPLSRGAAEGYELAP